MGNRYSCKFENVFFYNLSDKKKIQNDLINHIIKREKSYFSTELAVISGVTSVYHEPANYWFGTIYYNGQTGTFIIEREKWFDFCRCC